MELFPKGVHLLGFGVSSHRERRLRLGWWRVPGFACVGRASVDRASVDELSLDRASVDELSVDRASVDELSVDRAERGPS